MSFQLRVSLLLPQSVLDPGARICLSLNDEATLRLDLLWLLRRHLKRVLDGLILIEFEAKCPLGLDSAREPLAAQRFDDVLLFEVLREDIWVDLNVDQRLCALLSFLEGDQLWLLSEDSALLGWLDRLFGGGLLRAQGTFFRAVTLG